MSVDVNTQYNLTVTDINGEDVISMQQLYIHFIFLCSPITGQEDKKKICSNYYQCFYVDVETTIFSLLTIDNNNILITSVTVGVMVPFFMIVVMVVAVVTFVLLIRNGKIL